jgi:transcriptional regulator with XRE-family HTH domain
MSKRLASFNGSKIARARAERRWSISDLHFELAKHGLRVTLRSLINWERGTSIPSSKYLPTLAVALRKPLGYFFDQKQHQTKVTVLARN